MTVVPLERAVPRRAASSVAAVPPGTPAPCVLALQPPAHPCDEGHIANPS